jgi:hypothetical protein
LPTSIRYLYSNWELLGRPEIATGPFADAWRGNAVGLKIRRHTERRNRCDEEAAAGFTGEVPCGAAMFTTWHETASAPLAYNRMETTSNDRIFRLQCGALSRALLPLMDSADPERSNSPAKPA